jgi:hypothetical protein
LASEIRQFLPVVQWPPIFRTELCRVNRPREFTVVDLTARCDVRQQERYEYALLERIPRAWELLADLSSSLWKHPEGFEQGLLGTHLSMRWVPTADTAGIASLREAHYQDQPERTLAISILASGANPDADTQTIATFHSHVVRELHDTGYEPAFDLLSLTARPMLATMSMFAPRDPDDQWLCALADRCFAAAYFRQLGLA